MPRSGLSADSVTRTAAALADDVGFDHLSMGQLADRLGVKTPSLYKHVSSQADLAHRIAALAVDELADTIRDATQGKAGPDALTAGAWAMRTWVQDHPGRYAAGNAATVSTTDPGDPLRAATERLLASWSAMLGGYRLDPAHEIHALRTLRSLLHGFSTLESAGGFQIDTDVEATFTWMITFLDQGLTRLRT